VLGTTMVLGTGLDQFLYAPGDKLYAYRESLAFNTRVGGFFRNRVAYTKGLTDGNSPFLFDQLGTRYHNVKESLTFYYLNNLNWTTSAGYNWQTAKWLDINTSLLMKPTEKLYWRLRSGWDIENIRYKDLINTLKLYPVDFFSLQYSTVTDMNAGTLKSGSILYNLYLLKGASNQWKIKLSQVYDSSAQQFKQRDIMLVKDLHCWELTYTYSDYRKEVSVMFSLKALPGEPIGMSTGRGIYLEGLEKSIKGLKPEGAIKRY